MKITVFTITDCYFCKQEKDYLKSNNLPFEEKNLEENRDWLTEMLTISNNFAGTPVTKIEKDDGAIVVLKGFTKEEFDETLGIKTNAVKTVAEAPVTPIQEVKPVAEEPKVEAQSPAAAAPAPQVAPVPAAAPAPVAAAPDAAAIAAQIEELKKLQESLMSKPQAVVQAPAAAAPAPQVAPVPAAAPTPVAAAPAPVAAAPTPQVAPVPAAAPTQNAVDDSLAAILAELQAKINSANSGGTQGQQS